MVVRDRIELSTQGFSILCSTDWAIEPLSLLNRSGGERRIRTFEAVGGGFTVRRIWPLSNLTILKVLKFLDGVEGFEPSSDGTKNRCLTAWRYPRRTANKIKVELVKGVEPPTCWLQISCSSQLSYTSTFNLYKWCQKRDLNSRPPAYETSALASWATLTYIN